MAEPTFKQTLQQYHIKVFKRFGTEEDWKKYGGVCFRPTKNWYIVYDKIYGYYNFSPVTQVGAFFKNATWIRGKYDYWLGDYTDDDDSFGGSFEPYYFEKAVCSNGNREPYHFGFVVNGRHPFFWGKEEIKEPILFKTSEKTTVIPEFACLEEHKIFWTNFFDNLYLSLYDILSISILGARSETSCGPVHFSFEKNSDGEDENDDWNIKVPRTLRFVNDTRVDITPDWEQIDAAVVEYSAFLYNNFWKNMDDSNKKE